MNFTTKPPKISGDDMAMEIIVNGAPAGNLVPTIMHGGSIHWYAKIAAAWGWQECVVVTLHGYGPTHELAIADAIKYGRDLAAGILAKTNEFASAIGEEPAPLAAEPPFEGAWTTQCQIRASTSGDEYCVSYFDGKVHWYIHPADQIWVAAVANFKDYNSAADALAKSTAPPGWEQSQDKQRDERRAAKETADKARAKYLAELNRPNWFGYCLLASYNGRDFQVSYPLAGTTYYLDSSTIKWASEPKRRTFCDEASAIEALCKSEPPPGWKL